MVSLSLQRRVEKVQLIITLELGNNQHLEIQYEIILALYVIFTEFSVKPITTTTSFSPGCTISDSVTHLMFRVGGRQLFIYMKIKFRGTEGAWKAMNLVTRCSRRDEVTGAEARVKLNFLISSITWYGFSLL